MSAEEKTARYERELDDARLSVNEKFDRYTEGLYKRVSEETDLSKLFLDVITHLTLPIQFIKQTYLFSIVS